MKERPILFSAPMVRAILEGRKTQTRRAVKPQPNQDWHPEGVGMYAPTCVNRQGEEYPGPEVYGASDEDEGRVCPYGKPGDRLWVRETFWRCIQSTQEMVGFPDGQVKLRSNNGTILSTEPDADHVGYGDAWKCRPSIFMPRWASRITLEITDVRVQRLQDISEEDALAEGLTQDLCEQVLLDAAGKVSPDEAYYVTNEDKDDLTEGYLCCDCATREAARSKGCRVNAAACPESDGPAYCDQCYRPLYLSLTAYGIEGELFLECPSPEDRKHFSAKGLDAAIAAMFAGGIGDLRDEHLGRLAQVGFATLWESINGVGSWDANPWVWAITFKRLEVGGAK